MARPDHLPGMLLPAPPPIEEGRDALFLDLDGTLADLAATPGAVRIEPDMRRAVAAAHHALAGRVAVVSGRAIADLDRLLGSSPLSLAGVHGLETRDSLGVERRLAPSAGFERARLTLADLGARQPRLLVEDKGLGVAVHYRLAPDLAAIAEREARSVAEAEGLTLQTGKMVFEVRDSGADKGAAVRAFMAAPPFEHARPIFVGDDDTDECAFEAVAAMGGYGVLVGEPRPTAARHGLPDVEAVQHWLATAGRAE